MPKMFLIGMPGSGKSTMGKLLAKELKYNFLDLDQEIERKEGATIEAIFELKGEAYFRQIEAQILSSVSERHGNFVIATGGGTPCFYNGISLMNKVGKTIFINVLPNVLIDRLKADTVRPLLKSGVEERVQLLYKERIEIYLKAQMVLDGETQSSEELSKVLAQQLVNL